MASPRIIASSVTTRPLRLLPAVRYSLSIDSSLAVLMSGSSSRSTTNTETDDDRHQQTHGGHDPESGLLTRLRTWVDVLPWLRLGRVARIAGSPLLIALVASATVIWWFPAQWLTSDGNLAWTFGRRETGVIGLGIN